MKEDNLIQSELQRLGTFIQSTSSPTLELSSDGTIIYFNEAARVLAEASLKRYPMEVLPIDAKTIVEDCVATGMSHHRYETTSDGRTVSWCFIPVAERKTVHCLGRFVTQQKPGEGATTGINTELFSEWIEGIAHELNNILTLIQSHASFLITEKQLDSESADSTRQIYSAVDRAAKLTDKLYSLRRREGR